MRVAILSGRSVLLRRIFMILKSLSILSLEMKHPYLPIKPMERKRQFRKQGIFYGIIDKGRRNRLLSFRQKKRNKKKSKIRSRVERVFAHFKHHYGYRRARYVKLKRNELQFKFLCMVYNIRQGIALTTT